MNKRQFMGAALAAGVPAACAVPRPGNSSGPVLLTLTGAIGQHNRGAFDPGRDILMGKHKLAFSKAMALDFGALSALPAVTIKPTLEYDATVHTLRGPLLGQVLALAGVRLHKGSRVALRALDGYAASTDGAQIAAQQMIVATHMDGQPLAMGGLGPLWAVYDADRIPALATRPLTERFAACPWGLYHIDVLG